MSNSPDLRTLDHSGGALTAKERIRVGAVEPFFGGSHRRFLEDLAAHSVHEFEWFTMPARFWKWRMHGAAVTLLDDIDRLAACDVLLVSDFLNVAEFLGLANNVWPSPSHRSQMRRPPLALFMHENQLTYPVQDSQPAPAERDHHYGFVNITSALAADRVWFNSAFHRDEFLDAASAFLARMPDAVPRDVAPRIAAKSEVMHLGALAPGESERGSVLRVCWNHRWEFDKNPDPFFEALFALHAEGTPFELVVLGEQFESAPPVFDRAKRELADVIVHWGFAESRAEYLRWLSSCHVAVSTANHEFFGISAVEAALSGCALLLPQRLSYPELIPQDLHSAVLYASDAAVPERLRAWAAQPGAAIALGEKLRASLRHFEWSARVTDFDAALLGLARDAR